MREIKIKFWEGFKKIWLNPELFVVNSDGNVERKLSAGIVAGCVPVFYTGLKDKNDKKIFEGDILNYKALNDRLKSIDENIFIEYGKHCYITRKEVDGVVTAIDQIKCRSCEIVGNIYENPELIQKPNSQKI